MRIKEFFSLQHDKEYFDRLKTDINNNRKQKIILYIGLIIVITSTMLNLYTKLVNYLTLTMAWLLGYLLIYYALSKISKTNKKPKVEQDPNKKINPVSLGILYFSFALPLWTYWENEQKATPPIFDLRTLVSALVISCIAVFYFIASYSSSIRDFANDKVNKILIGLNFIAFFAGFVLGWVPTFGQASGIILYFIMFFGFAWIVTILLGLVEELKTGITNIVMIGTFVTVAITKFFKLDSVGIIAGCVLSSISLLYGDVLDQG